MSALIYLFGFPGVGKQTIARAIESQAPFLALENHLLSNPFRQILGHLPAGDYRAIEPLLRHHTMKAWVNLLAFIAAAAPGQPLILTSVLYGNDPDRAVFFDFVRDWAEAQKRLFLPVRLVCDPGELERRLQSDNRREAYKLTDPAVLRSLQGRCELLDPADALELDVTDITPDEAARQVLDYLHALSVK